MWMGVSVVRGTFQTGSHPGPLTAWKGKLSWRHVISWLPSCRSDKSGISEDCGPGEEKQDPRCVSWGGRVSISQTPSSLEEMSSNHEPGVLMNFLCLLLSPSRPQSMLGAHE